MKLPNEIAEKLGTYEAAILWEALQSTRNDIPGEELMACMDASQLARNALIDEITRHLAVRIV